MKMLDALREVQDFQTRALEVAQPLLRMLDQSTPAMPLAEGMIESYRRLGEASAKRLLAMQGLDWAREASTLQRAADGALLTSELRRFSEYLSKTGFDGIASGFASFGGNQIRSLDRFLGTFRSIESAFPSIARGLESALGLNTSLANYVASQVQNARYAAESLAGADDASTASSKALPTLRDNSESFASIVYSELFSEKIREAIPKKPLQVVLILVVIFLLGIANDVASDVVRERGRMLLESVFERLPKEDGQQAESVRLAIVSASTSLRLRSKPSRKGAVLARLPAGSVVVLLSSARPGGMLWIKVRVITLAHEPVGATVEGFVSGRYLKPIDLDLQLRGSQLP